MSRNWKIKRNQEIKWEGFNTVLNCSEKCPIKISPFVSPAIHIKTLLLLVVLCEKSNGAATARPSKGRPRRTEAVKRLNFCSQPSCCGIIVRRLLDLRRVRRNIAATSKLGCDSRRDSPCSRRKRRKQWLNSLDYVYR